MKKLLKKCFVIVLCAATLLGVPSPALAATSIPTCEDFGIFENGGYVKLYRFTPDYYELDDGTAFELIDYVGGDNGHWVVYAGYKAYVSCWLPTPAECQILVYEVSSQGNWTLAYNFSKGYSKDQSFVLPSKSFDTKYAIILIPKTDTCVSSYSCVVDIN